MYKDTTSIEIYRMPQSMKRCPVREKLRTTLIHLRMITMQKCAATRVGGN